MREQQICFNELFCMGVVIEDLSEVHNLPYLCIIQIGN